MSLPHSSRARFGDFDADFKTGELMRRGEPTRLQDLPFRMLQALVERPGELVTRAELRERLWGADTFVDYEAGLNTAVAKLREALDDSADSPRFVETVPKRGYRFVGDVVWVGPPSASTTPVPAVPAADASVIAARVPVWRQPVVVIVSLIALAVAGYAIWRARAASPPATRIAVALFDNETGRPELDRLAQQLTDATVFALTARADLAVVGNAAVLRTPRPFRDIGVIRDALHADYIVIGQIQMQDAATIIRTHLIRAADQAHVWVEVTPMAAGSESALEQDVAARVERGVAAHVPPRK